MLWYTYTKKLRSTNAKIIHTNNPEEDIAVQQISTQMLRKKISALPRDCIITAQDEHNRTLFELERSEIIFDEDEEDNGYEEYEYPSENEDESENESNVVRYSPEYFPERFLKLMITAQESATNATRKALETMAEAMAIQNTRNQELLERYSEMVQRQHAEISRLIEEKHEAEESASAVQRPTSEIIESLVESLAPVIAPIVLKLQQQNGEK